MPGLADGLEEWGRGGWGCSISPLSLILSLPLWILELFVTRRTSARNTQGGLLEISPFRCQYGKSQASLGGGWRLTPGVTVGPHSCASSPKGIFNSRFY